MFDRFKHRSNELEHLDKGDYTAAEYEGCLVELRRINSWLGDTRALRQSLLAEIARKDLDNVSVLDVGAGSGELLRAAARWARYPNRKAMFVGIELNERSAQSIAEESKSFPEIHALQANGFKLPFADGAFDYVICSLITHHFQDQPVITFLRELARTARREIFVIDLHRDPLAYFFYTTIGKLFFHNRLIREDGALSILRSFKPTELANLARSAGLQNVEVSHSFPARLVLKATPPESREETASEPRTMRTHPERCDDSRY